MCAVFAVFVLIRYFLIAPTIVKHKSMQPTLQENQRLFLDRTYQISHRPLKVGELVAFEAPSKTYTKADADQKNPVAVYENSINGIINKFSYYVLEISKTNYIKRVIALEGDKVKILNGKVFVNGTLQEESFLPEDVQTNSGVFYDLIVPEGYVFVLGDNRPNSLDSRELGCIPLEKIEGVVFFRFWPFNVFGKIS
jgi:signal peptidase I